MKKTTRMSPQLLVVPALIVIVVFFLWPLASLFLESFTTPEPGLGNYAKILGDETTRKIISRTFVVAITVTLTTLVLAYPYAYLMSTVGAKARVFLMFLVLLPFWSSILARTFAWLVIFQPSGPLQQFADWLGIPLPALLGTQVGVTIAMAQTLLPFMVMPLFNNMVKIDRNLLNAAYSMGASKFRAFLRVYVPLSIPGISAGSVLVFVLSLGFWITPRIIGSPQQAMIGQLLEIRIRKLLDFAGAGALAVVLLILTGILLSVSALLQRKLLKTGATRGTD